MSNCIAKTKTRRKWRNKLPTPSSPHLLKKPSPATKHRLIQPATEQCHLPSYQITSHIPYLFTFFIEDVNAIQQQHNPYHSRLFKSLKRRDKIGQCSFAWCSSVSWYFAYTITQTNDHWLFGVARWGHYTVHKHRALKIQWRGAISKKGKDLKFTAAKAWNLARVQGCLYLTITQAIIDTSERASRGKVQFPELIEFEFCS